MTCKNCGSAVVSLVEQDGGTVSGKFYEYYECHDCGAKGTVRGDAGDPPAKWLRTGPVFSGGIDG